MTMFIPSVWTSNGKLFAVVLLVVVAQQIWIYLAHRHYRTREELFRIITENAADMIALVNVKGRRFYNSPAYHKILGYSAAELVQTTVFEQIHPDDRFKVLEAAREARLTGIGKSLEYRVRHKNGSWRILESTASTIRKRRRRSRKTRHRESRHHRSEAGRRTTRPQRAARRDDRSTQSPAVS